MLWTILVSIVLGALIGWIAGKLMKTRLSLLWCIICGVLGSALGGWIGSLLSLALTFSLLGITLDIMGLILAIVCACLVVFVVGKLKKK